MERMATGPGSGWRRLTAYVLVFALVLQSVVLTLAGTRRTVDPVGIAHWAGFELCRHDGGATPGSPPESPPTDGHCLFCLAAATCVDTPVATTQFHSITFAVLPWSFAGWRLPAAKGNASAPPRGPPVIA